MEEKDEIDVTDMEKLEPVQQKAIYEFTTVAGAFGRQFVEQNPEATIAYVKANGFEPESIYPDLTWHRLLELAGKFPAAA